MSELLARLESLSPLINDICRVSGTPGVSIGVLHNKQVVYTKGFGFRDVEKKLSADENTIYYLASLTKAFTAACVGVLVERKKLSWTTPIHKILPSFQHFDPVIREDANVVDWLSHKTGLAPKNAMWCQEFGHYSMLRKDVIPTTNYLEKIYDFRTRWLYNNWGYALADEVIQKLSGQSWGSFLKESIFDPLGMHRTITDHSSKLDNIAEAYMAFGDGTPYHLPRPFPEDGKIMEGAVAVQSNVRDLLVFYKEIMRVAEIQTSHDSSSTSDSPLKELPTLLKAHINLSPEPSPKERSYALGWVRTELPGSLGVIGLNGGYVNKMPTVGKGLDRSRLCLYHQGSNNTFLSSVHLLPDTHSGVVVLTNSMANNDAADWLGELLLETLLDNQDKNDYLELAKSSAATSKNLWVKMKQDLDEHRTPGTSPKAYNAYCGSFYNYVGNYCLDIFMRDEVLWMCFQGDFDQAYELEHYHFDVFSWMLTMDEDVRMGRYPMTRPSFYLLKFKSDDQGEKMDSLVWVNDSAVPDGEEFRRDWKPRSDVNAQNLEGPR